MFNLHSATRGSCLPISHTYWSVSLVTSHLRWLLDFTPNRRNYICIIPQGWHVEYYRVLEYNQLFNFYFLLFLVDLSGFSCNIYYIYKDIGKPQVRLQGAPFLSSPVKAPWTHGFLFLTFLLASPPPGSFCPHSFHTWEANWSFVRNPENFTLLSAQAFFLFVWNSAGPAQLSRGIIGLSVLWVPHSTFLKVSGILEPILFFFLIVSRVAGFLHKMANFLSTKVYSVFFFPL